MKQRQTIKRLLGSLTMGALLTACGAPEESTTQARELDSDIQCPEGQIPWKFPSKGTKIDSEEYSASAEGARCTVSPSKVVASGASTGSSTRTFGGAGSSN